MSRNDTTTDQAETPAPTEDVQLEGDSVEETVRRGRWAGTPFVLLGGVAATIWLVVGAVAALVLLVWWLA
jgi:hypothetical protein